MVSEIAPLSLNDGILEPSISSIMKLVLALEDNSTSMSIFKSVVLTSFKHKVVQFLSIEFNGDFIFELPAFATLRKEKFVDWMVRIVDIMNMFG